MSINNLGIILIKSFKMIYDKNKYLLMANHFFFLVSKKMILVVFALVLPILGTFGKTIQDISSLNANFIVEIPDGKIVGTTNYTVDKKTTYYAFRGIQYAQPPLGDLRFAPPRKNEKWTGFWDATDDASECVQGSGDNVRGSEDCLYVNVYTPSTKRKNIPVMVWIYGGSFTSGSSQYREYGPDYFLEEDVVFVSFNYRVGPLGFLSTEDGTAPGNWGLKDQVLALQWVKDNIQYFGGNPNRITIFGESAGGASVSYLLQSPKAQGLFNAAILQSGTSTMLWAFNTRARQLAFQIGTGLGNRTLDSTTLINNLRNVDAYRLQRQALNSANQLLALNPLRGLLFSPCIEIEHPDALITQSSDEYFRSGRYPNKVPILIGHNSNEGGAAHEIPENLLNYLLYMDATTNNLAPYSLTSSAEKRSLAANEIRLHYFGVDPMRDQLSQVVKFINTDQFNRAVRRVAQNVAPFAPTYFYVMGYEGTVFANNGYQGVGHAEDLQYLFRSYNNKYSKADLQFRSKFVRLWTNFAKTYNPTPKKDKLLNKVIWTPVNPNSKDFDYVWLNSTFTMARNPDQKGWRFYDGIFYTYGDGNYTTY